MTHVDTPHSRVCFAAGCEDITPPAGIYHRMWGAATHERAEGVHRPLAAYVAVFAPVHSSAAESSSPPTAIISLDHCLLGREEMDQLIAAVEQATSFSAAQLLFTFTHTHGAGLMSLDRVHLPGGELIPGYLDSVAKTVAELLQAAAGQLVDATIVYGFGRCSLAAHRDFWDETSRQWVCGFNPDTPADDTLLVARVTDGIGRTLATFVNYACHPTTLAWENRLISPDYPGAMRELVQRATAGAPCLFLQGASGELGPREGFVGDPAIADRNGRILGHAVLATLESLPPPLTRYEYAGPVVSGATLGVWKHTPPPADRLLAIARWECSRDVLPLPYRPDLPTTDATRRLLVRHQAAEQSANKQGDAAAARDAHAQIERATRMLRRLEQLPGGGGMELPRDYPFQSVCWRMGDAVWIAVEGEHYSLLQTELRRRFSPTPIIVITLFTGWGPSYLPTRQTYGQGLYPESIAVLAAGCLEAVIERLSSRIEALLLP